VVKKILAEGGYSRFYALGGGFADPYGVALDGAGNVYVSDTGNNAVKRLPNLGSAPTSSAP
jgi:streptogramin lyase